MILIIFVGNCTFACPALLSSKHVEHSRTHVLSWNVNKRCALIKLTARYQEIFRFRKFPELAIIVSDSDSGAATELMKTAVATLPLYAYTHLARSG